jgi:hypothetical protein
MLGSPASKRWGEAHLRAKIIRDAMTVEIELRVHKANRILSPSTTRLNYVVSSLSST